MFTFKVYYTDGATEVFTASKYRTRPRKNEIGGHQLEVNINDSELFLYVTQKPTGVGCTLTESGDIDVIYVVNENGKTVDTIGR